MVNALVRGGITKSEIYKSMRNFDVKFGIRRKAALVVNGIGRRFFEEEEEQETDSLVSDTFYIQQGQIKPMVLPIPPIPSILGSAIALGYPQT